MTLNSNSFPLLTSVLALGLVISACGPTADPAGSADASAEWPRTVSGDAGTVELGEPPERIVAMSSDAADVALELVDADRIAAVPELSRDPLQSGQSGAAAEVEGVVAAGGDVAAEDIAAHDPDLVLITERHGAEHRVVDQLVEAGLPVLAIGNTWDTPEAYAQNVTLIGTALGAETRAEELLAEYRMRWDAAASARPSGGEAPRAAVLRVIAGRVMFSGPGSITQAVLEAAGLVSVAEELGMAGTQPAAVEQLIAADPDVLVLVDSTGAGREGFTEFLGAAGSGAIPAVAEDRVLLVTAAEMSSGAGALPALERLVAEVP